MSTGETWTLGHRPALDGLRGVAILLVIASHAWLPEFRSGGAVGVTVFFTLSGFLITALLLREHETTGRISLRGFYARRARRLFPALFTSVAAVAVASLWLGDWFFRAGDAAAVAGYVGNWMMVDGGHLGGLSGTWSLAVEEQFYLVWPLLVIVAAYRGGPRAVAWVAGVGVVASMSWRHWLVVDGTDWARIYHGTDTRADSLLIGCLLAVTLHLSRARRPLPGTAGTAVVIVALLGYLAPERATLSVPLLVPILTAVAIYGLARGGDPRGWLSSKPMVWIGRRSYGLYLWHTPVSAYMTLAHPELTWHVRLPVLLLVSVPITVLCWRYVEQPFLRTSQAARTMTFLPPMACTKAGQDAGSDPVTAVAK